MELETGEGFTMDELVAEVSLLILAGKQCSLSATPFATYCLACINYKADTRCIRSTHAENQCRCRQYVYRCTAISSTIFYLLHNPSCLSKISTEIRTAFSYTEEIRGGSRLINCAYLRACIDEALRMTPGVGGILPREVLPGGINIDGNYYPAGVDVGVPIYAIQHNSAYYSEPFDFIPERWLVDYTVESVSLRSAEPVALAKSAFYPFSVGPRAYAGKGIAYKVLMVAIARLVYLFEMRIAENTTLGEGDPSLDEKTMRHRQGEFQGLDKFVMEMNGPMVQFKLRDGVELE